MSDTGIVKAFNVFDSAAKDVLTVDLKLNGEVQRVSFLRDLILDGDGLIDYNKLLERLQKIPGMVTFYGVMKDHAGQEVKAAEEELRMWYAKVSVTMQKELITATQNLAVASGLKKAPTMSEVETAVMVKYKQLWEDKKAKIRKAEEQYSMLSHVSKGMEVASNMVQSQTKLLMLLWDKGVEEVRGRLPVNR